LDERDPYAHWVLARAHCWRHEHDQAIAELGTALTLNPSFASAHFLLGWVLTYAGRPEEALPHLDKALRLSPHDPFIMGIMGIRSVALMFMGRLEEALQWARESARHPVAHFQSRAGLVSILGRLNRINEAKAALDEIIRRRPDYSCALIERTSPFKHQKDLEYYLDGLRNAGLPAQSLGMDAPNSGTTQRPIFVLQPTVPVGDPGRGWCCRPAILSR
ncbi:MAG: tetratricopeptide repeat protein, partial [Nitrospirota bacterium]|nr:tetratricopeptide repeat protein [Nitrospirota bacterium]